MVQSLVCLIISINRDYYHTILAKYGIVDRKERATIDEEIKKQFHLIGIYQDLVLDNEAKSKNWNFNL